MCVLKMLLTNICFFSCVFVLLLPMDASGQICTKRQISIVSSIQPYTYSYREQYRTRCWYGGTCTKTRLRFKVDHRTITNRKWVTSQFCCEGYINIASGYRDYPNSNMLVCQPICIPSCKNGYCKSPGNCACNDGYEASFDAPHVCSPVCEDGCENGVCTAPETCSCNFGYTSNNGTCEPICTERCINGTCISPDTCECDPGYRKSESNKCEPYCSTGCSNGSCVEPEVCACNEGYTNSDDQCIPYCKDCRNGTCVAPNTCECLPGFATQNEICSPVCTPPCENGICEAPNTCTCNDGYRFNVDRLRCEPTEVYETTATGFDEALSAPVCRNCAGTCVRPNLCICDSEYEAKNQTADGEDCNCFDNCTDDMIRCDRTICIPNFKTRTTSEPYYESTTTKTELKSSVTTTPYFSVTLYNFSTTAKEKTMNDYSYSEYWENENNEVDYNEFNNNKLNNTDDVTSNDTFKNNTYENSTDNFTAVHQNKEKSRSGIPLIWICVAIAAIAIFIILALVLVLKRNAIANFFGKGSYVIKDKTYDVCPERRSTDVRFSTVAKSAQD